MFSCDTWTKALYGTDRSAKAGRENGKMGNMRHYQTDEGTFFHSHPNILKSSAATTIILPTHIL